MQYWLGTESLAEAGVRRSSLIDQSLPGIDLLILYWMAGNHYVRSYRVVTSEGGGKLGVLASGCIQSNKMGILLILGYL